MKTLWIMCGAPGSGKSTWLKRNIKDSGKVVSRDEIRFALLGDNEEYFNKERQVWKTYINTIRDRLNKYDDVFADATHLNEKSRTKLLNALNINTDAVRVNCLCFDADLDVCLQRNAERTGRKRVPDETLKEMYNTYVEPHFFEKYGYDEIYLIDDDGSYGGRKIF